MTTIVDLRDFARFKYQQATGAFERCPSAANYCRLEAAMLTFQQALHGLTDEAAEQAVTECGRAPLDAWPQIIVRAADDLRA